MRINKLILLFVLNLLFIPFVPLAPARIANASVPPACKWVWTPIPTPNPSAPDFARRIALRNDNDVWVAGTNLWHWDGTAWTFALAGKDNGFQDIVTFGKHRVYALAVQVMFSKGKQWRRVGKLNFPNPTGLAVVSPKNIWVAVGASGNSQASSSGVSRFLHWNGFKWKKVKGIFPGQVRNIQVVGPDDIWAAGDDLLHWDGSAWTRVETGISGSQYTLITVIDSNNIWAAGTHGLVAHWDGSAWTVVSNPETLYENYSGMLALAADDVWLTSDYRISHWDGAHWTFLYSGPSPYVGSNFGDIARDGSDRLWVVGNLEGDSAWAERSNGDTWDSFDLLDPTRPAKTSFHVITALSPNDVWVGGKYGDFPRTSDFVLFAHWNGIDWSFGNMAHLPGAIDAMSAVSTDDIWAAGGDAFYHYDGVSWSKIPGPSNGPPIPGGPSRIYSITALAAVSHNDVWAVGNTFFHNAADAVGAAPVPNPSPLYFMFGPPLIAHWDGTQWSEFSTSIPFGDGNTLYSVVALASNDVWAVGTFSETGNAGPLAIHWDGNSWSIIPIPDTISQGELLSVTASAPDSIWAVGEAYDNGASSALTAHWDGQAWQTFEDSSAYVITNAAVASSNSLWGVGPLNSNSFIALWTGGTWQKFWTSTQDTYLGQLSELSPGLIWAVGQQDSKSLIVRGACN